MKKLILFLIKIYQKTISFDHGLVSLVYPVKFCRFYPTCSQYSYQAIEKYGIIKGIRMGIKRIFRCHPWNEGGYDPLK
jgi:putative membrane protein insertion efficiency factor